MTKLRSIRNIELEMIEKYIDWEKLASLIPKKRSRRGRKPYYSENQLLKVVVLQDIEGVEDDTEMERKLEKASDYREFCQLDRVPSHDTISKFKRTLSHKSLKRVHETTDRMLEEYGIFDEDELCGDGTKIPLPENVDIATWGATSNKDIFLGMWMMTMNSTKTELVRDFNIGTARIGQIVLMKHLIYNTSITGMEKLGKRVYLDGIFDEHEIRRYIFRNWNKIAMIPYNSRNSKVKEAKDLPEDNWRLVFTPEIKNGEEFKKKCSPRTGVERENGRLKEWTLIGKLYEKAKKAFRVTGRYIVNQMIISLISTQVRALAYRIHELMQPVIVQTTLKNF